MTKTTIRATDERHVTITFTDHASDEPVTMEIWAPQPASEGLGLSYVRYNGNQQLCDRLDSRGETLSYKRGTQLIDLVRREYKAMRAAEKREESRYA